MKLIDIYQNLYRLIENLPIAPAIVGNELNTGLCFNVKEMYHQKLKYGIILVSAPLRVEVDTLAHEIAHCCYIKGNKLALRKGVLQGEKQVEKYKLKILELAGMTDPKKFQDSINKRDDKLVAKEIKKQRKRNGT